MILKIKFNDDYTKRSGVFVFDYKLTALAMQVIRNEETRVSHVIDLMSGLSLIIFSILCQNSIHTLVFFLTMFAGVHFAIHGLLQLLANRKEYNRSRREYEEYIHPKNK